MVGSWNDKRFDFWVVLVSEWRHFTKLTSGAIKDEINQFTLLHLLISTRKPKQKPAGNRGIEKSEGPSALPPTTEYGWNQSNQIEANVGQI